MTTPKTPLLLNESLKTLKLPTMLREYPAVSRDCASSDACRRGHRVRFFTASGLVHEYLEAREERRILRLEASLARTDLIVVDELGYLARCRRSRERTTEISQTSSLIL